MSDKADKNMYNIALLMEQTRLVAADYRHTTGQALPVTAELARFDAIDKLDLQKMDADLGYDAVNPNDLKEKFLIKGRVIFKAGKARQKLGQLQMDGEWNWLLVVIYDADYTPKQIHRVDRAIIEEELEKSPSDKRGSMTVAKFKAIGKLVWEPELESSEQPAS